MFIEIMQGLGIFYLWTWFIWPFVFVFSLVYSITTLVKDEKASIKPAIVASLALIVILAGIMYPTLK